MTKYIWIKTKCDDYYSLINTIRKLNLDYLETKKNKQEVFLKIKEKDLVIINQKVPNYYFLKEKDTGIFQLFRIIKKEKMLIIAFLIGIIIFAILNHLIVEIDIVHENKEIRELISDELKEEGIKVLSFRKNYYELTKIKEKIKAKYPDKIDWLEIERIGMKYVVRIEERIINQKEEEIPFCDVYAKKDGLIVNYSLHKGMMIKNIGDYVKTGDLLISGKIIYNDEIKSEVCAKGEVLAERWYEVNIKLPLIYKEEVKTGKIRYNLIWESENSKKRIFNLRLKSFISQNTTLFSFFNYHLLLEKEEEIKKIEKKYSEEEALNKAFLLAQEKINIKINDKDVIISEKVLKKRINDSTMDMDIFIITNEVIN